MAKAAAISFKEFRTRYHTEEACREELFRQRFPEGFVSPKCGCKEFYAMRSRNIYQGRSCRHQTSVTAGTVMHRTHLPLTVWFWAIYLCVTDKRGISAVQLSRFLEISYDTAWRLLERSRRAMGQRDERYQLSGIVEMDDYFVGGPSHNGKQGRNPQSLWTPEMNPIEQIWKELRKRGFRNEVFASLEKAVDRLCDTICVLSASTIYSITARYWLLAGFY